VGKLPVRLGSLGLRHPPDLGELGIGGGQQPLPAPGALTSRRPIREWSSFLAQGFWKSPGQAASAAGHSVMIWLQVRDINAEHERLAAADVHSA
jgi:hypothetical protein